MFEESVLKSSMVEFLCVVGMSGGGDELLCSNPNGSGDGLVRGVSGAGGWAVILEAARGDFNRGIVTDI